MLEIKPCFDIPTLAVYAKNCGKAPGESLYLYMAKDGGETLAAGLFEVQSDKVCTLFYESADPDDIFLFDGILRAGLNYASEQGIETGCIPEDFRQSHKNKFARLNYPPETEMNIVNFFNKYKNCAI